MQIGIGFIVKIIYGGTTPDFRDCVADWHLHSSSVPIHERRAAVSSWITTGSSKSHLRPSRGPLFLLKNRNGSPSARVGLLSKSEERVRAERDAWLARTQSLHFFTQASTPLLQLASVWGPSRRAHKATPLLSSTLTAPFALSDTSQ